VDGKKHLLAALTPKSTKHFVFISTNPSWSGGGETLWIATAIAALEYGYRVTAYIAPGLENHLDAKRMAAAGAKVLTWKLGAGLPSIFERIARKLFGLGHRKPYFWKNHLPRDADVFCINQGGPFCVTFLDDLPEVLLERRKPFVCLARSDRMVHPMTSEWRLKAQTFFLQCNSYVTASEANLESASRMLAMPLRGMSLHSPIADFSGSVTDWPQEDTLQLACVGRLLARDKGQDILLASLAREAWKNRAFRLSIYGDGPDLNYLQELCSMLKLNEKVVFAGRIPNSGVAWRNCHLAILPSLSEGTPQVMLEAMLCNRAVVATAVGGIPEWLQEGRGGFLAEAPTADYLESALERAWNNKNLLFEMGKTARKSALSKMVLYPDKFLLKHMEKINDL
jgi:L-malate glycosyltransferase